MSEDKIVLSFHETLLRQSDVDLLDGNCWLNDTIISFYFEYLENVAYADKEDFLFVSPEVTQCIKMLDENEVGLFLDPLDIVKKKYIFFAVNDNDSARLAGGSHWSLLVYSQIENKFYHFDSMEGTNDEPARVLYRKLAHYIGKGNCKTSRVNTLQQVNGYDCGIHVLCNVDLVAAYVLEHTTIMPNCPKVDEAIVRNKRKELISLIKRLREN